MKIVCAFGQHNYGDPSRGEGYEYSNFLSSLRRLGHEVIFFESLNRSAYPDFTKLNRALLDVVEQHRPDILLCVLMGYEIWLETLQIIRSSGVRLVSFGTDDSWRYPQFSRFVAPSFDVWATTSHDARHRALRDGLANFRMTQWAASSERLKEPLPARQCRYPVSFVGSAYGNRRKWIAALKDRGVDVACFGHGWPGGAVSADDVSRIMRESVVSLNFGDSGIQFRGLLPYRSRQIKARVFEVPGAGGFLLTELADHIDEYYIAGQEIDIFRDPDDLASKISIYVNNPDVRDAVARAGHQRTSREHTYEDRFRILLEEFSATKKRVATEMPLDLKKFDHAVATHRRGRRERICRALLTAPFRMLWGHRRGPRAARRLLVELSWRLVGRKTYTAAGFPGRLFYKES